MRNKLTHKQTNWRKCSRIFFEKLTVLSACQVIRRLLWNQGVQYKIQKRPTLVLTWTTLIQSTPSHPLHLISIWTEVLDKIVVGLETSPRKSLDRLIQQTWMSAQSAISAVYIHRSSATAGHPHYDNRGSKVGFLNKYLQGKYDRYDRPHHYTRSVYRWSLVSNQWTWE